MEIKNSTGYFADVDGTAFTCDTVRSGKSQSGWPMVKLSDGTEVKLAFRCFTKEERDWYYQHTGKGRFAQDKVTKNDELRNALLSIQKMCHEQITEKKVLKELDQVIANILPEDSRIAKFEKMLGGLSPEELEMLKAKLN